MSKIIATEEAIGAAIAAIVSRGQEPSMKMIQEEIGGGSYTTIARGLERWRAGREALSVVPAEVVDRSNRFMHEVWSIANDVAQRDVEAIRAQAQDQVSQALGDLREASQEIARLETVNADQEARLDAQSGQLNALQEDLTKARIQAARVDALDRELAHVRLELSQVRSLAEERGTALARLTGERDSALNQLRELTALLRPSDIRQDAAHELPGSVADAPRQATEPQSDP